MPPVFPDGHAPQSRRVPVRIRPKRKVSSAEVAYALGRAEAFREAHYLAGVWEKKGANAGAVRIVLMGKSAGAWDHYHDLIPLESAEAETPCNRSPASAVSSGLRAPGQKAATGPAQIIQLEDRRVGYPKTPPLRDGDKFSVSWKQLYE